jgi:hypothetical protein
MRTWTTTNDPLSRHGGPNHMNDDISGGTSKTEPATDWKRVRTMTDERIHAGVTGDPDIALPRMRPSGRMRAS